MRLHLALLFAFAFTTPAFGHFVYIVPDASGQEVQVVFSEVPAVDEKVAVEKIAGTQLTAIDDSGRRTRLKTEKFDHFLSAKLPDSAAVLLSGVTQYGVTNSKHTGNVPVHIKYFSKAVLGDFARASNLRLNGQVTLEIVPVLQNGKLQFLALSGGKPVADADCVVKSPGDEKGERAKTDAKGLVPGQFDKPGRYGVWVRTVDLSPGDLQGAHFDKTHTYATLVVDLPAR
jgi:hypothetical protein